MMGPKPLIVGFLALLSLSHAMALSADWPQWRGTNRAGLWQEEGIVERFAEPRLAIRWRVPIGPGYSGPTVAAGRVYVTDRPRDPANVERVLCFDAMTGRDVWSYSYECDYVRVGYPAGPRASVTIDAGRAYALGTMGHLFCLDAAGGNVVWSHDLRAEYQARVPTWGIASAPLVEKDLLIVQAGGKDNACLVAFDKRTGTEKWRALRDPVSYSAPIVIDQAGQRVLVCVTGERVVGVDPAAGKLHWARPFAPTRMVITITTPVVSGNYLFVASFYDGSLLLKLGRDQLTVEELWRRRGPNERETDALHCCISTAIIQGDHIYGVDSYGELRCLELRTGERVWESLEAVPKARWSNIHMIRRQDKVWMFNERGELIISRLSPSGFEQVSRAKLIDPTTAQLNQRGGVCWSHPAFAYKHVYARNDSELVCADLSAKP